MKHGPKLKSSWYVPPEAPDETTFACRACGATLTKNLRRQRFLDTHAHDYTGPLVPDDAYWIVAQGHLTTRFDGRQIDFMGCYAVHPEALVGVGKYPDPERWIGCCGPSGTGGPNRDPSASQQSRHLGAQVRVLPAHRCISGSSILWCRDHIVALVPEDLERFIEDRSKLRKYRATANATAFVMLDLWIENAQAVHFPGDCRRSNSQGEIVTAMYLFIDA